MFQMRSVPAFSLLSLAVSGLASAAWTRYATVGLGPIQENAVVAVDDEFYTLGGILLDIDGQWKSSHLVQRYHAKDDKWSVPAPLPVAMNHINAGVVDGKIYALGALNGSEWTEWLANPQTYMYDPFADTWDPLGIMPDARGASAVAVSGSTIYVAGGLKEISTSRNLTVSEKLVSAYDAATGNWTNLPDLPGGRDHVCGEVVGSTLYVIGGRDLVWTNVKDTVFALDLDNPVEWVEKASMPTARGGLQCATLGPSIYTFGGEGDLSSARMVFDDVEVYDTVTDSWKILDPMDVPRHGSDAVAYNGQIFIPGGGASIGPQPVSINSAFRP